VDPVFPFILPFPSSQVFIEASSILPSVALPISLQGIFIKMLGSEIVLLAIAFLAPSQADARTVPVSHPIVPRDALPLAPSSNILTLTRTKFGKGYNARGADYALGLAKIPASKHIATLTSSEYGQGFTAEITLGTQQFSLLVDTGSSDTWVVEAGYQCVNFENGAIEPEAFCTFGPTYTPSKTFVQTPDENFNITYESGEFLTGILGTEEIKLAGLKVDSTIAVVDNAAFFGDGIFSGILGLAYPDL
jgi:Eukaryotic aspartyl protease